MFKLHFSLQPERHQNYTCNVLLESIFVCSFGERSCWRAYARGGRVKASGGRSTSEFPEVYEIKTSHLTLHLKRAGRFYFTEDVVFVKSAFYKTYGQGNCLGLGGRGGRGSYSRESMSFEQLWPEEFGALS